MDVVEIRRACSAAKTLFVDDEFGDASWLRPEKIQRIGDEASSFFLRSRRRSDFCVIRDDARPEDVVQGSVGNCYFVSTIAAVVQTAPLFMKRLFVDLVKRDDDFGAHAVRLCVGGVWRIVIVDERFPVVGDGFTYMTQLAFATSKRRQLFPQLLEKAFAKICGSYERLEGGRAKEALALLTGCPCEDLTFSSAEDSPLEDSPLEEREALLWAKLLSAKEAGFIVCASTKVALATADLAPHHAYAVIDVFELYEAPPPIGSGHRHCLLRLANPHAAGSPFIWRGDWSEASSTWTRETRQEAQSRLGKAERNTGRSFFMSLGDLRRHFEVITVCESRDAWADVRDVFDLGNDRTAFEVTSLSQQVAEATFEIAKPLARANGNVVSGDAGILVVEDEKLASFAASTVENPIARCHTRSCLVLPVSFSAAGTATFVARTSAPVLVTPVTNIDPSLRRRLILDYVGRNGTHQDMCPGVRLSHRKDRAASFVAVANTDHLRRTLRIQVTLHSAKGIASSRSDPYETTNLNHFMVLSKVPYGHRALVVVVAATTAAYSYEMQHQCILEPHALNIVGGIVSGLRQATSRRRGTTTTRKSFFDDDEQGAFFQPPLRQGPDDVHCPVPCF